MATRTRLFVGSKNKMKQEALKHKSMHWINKKLRYFRFYLDYWTTVFFKYECNPDLRGRFNASESLEICIIKVRFIRRKIRQLLLLSNNCNKKY